MDAASIINPSASDLIARFAGKLNDSTYRRGYVHGLVAAVDALDAGATRAEICLYLDDLNDHWRMRSTDQLIPPPTFTEWSRRRQEGAK